MPPRLTLLQAVDFTVGLSLTGDQRFERAAGRLLGRLIVEQELTLEEARTVVRCFDALPDEPDRARTVLLS